VINTVKPSEISNTLFRQKRAQNGRNIEVNKNSILMHFMHLCTMLGYFIKLKKFTVKMYYKFKGQLKIIKIFAANYKYDHDDKKKDQLVI